jgi:hypothetical protein
MPGTGFILWAGIADRDSDDEVSLVGLLILRNVCRHAHDLAPELEGRIQVEGGKANMASYELQSFAVVLSKLSVLAEWIDGVGGCHRRDGECHHE